MNNFANAPAAFVSAMVVLVFLVAWLRQERAGMLSGWKFILAGAVLLLVGHLVYLDFLCAWMDSAWRSTIHWAGDLGGFLLLMSGFWQRSRWFFSIRADISRSRDLEEALRRQQVRLEEEVQSRTRDLQEARDQAIRANGAKSAFLADMSHEIRGPLNVVLGILELLRRARMEPQYREYIQLCHSSGRAVLSLLNDTLDFSKIEAGHLTLDLAVFDLRALVDEAALMMAPLAHSKGVELTAFVPRGLHTSVRGDPNRLRQILVNLLGNAVKFTPKGGVVELHVRIQARDSAKSEYYFEVWDTGIGVPEEQRERIFNKFTQVEHQPGQEHVEGTGLGLTISKRLVELMGGRIGVDANDRAGSGSVFHFSIFLEEVAETFGSPDMETLPTLRVLVIGSHGLQRVLLDDFFATLEIRHTHADDPQTSRTLLREAQAAHDPYRLLMVNQKAGGGERSEMVDLHEMLIPGVGVILLTDLLDHGLDQAANVPGDVLCLQKPISAVRLRGAIDRLLGEGLVHYAHPASRSGREQRHNPVRKLYQDRILIVDDHAANLKVASGMLQNLGCDPSLVDTTSNAASALEKLRQHDYGLVLMDCRMPGMDGLTATRAIRAREAEEHRPRLPVVAFTADIMEGKRRDCIEVGMDEILVKPVTLRTMENLLRKYLKPIAREEYDAHNEESVTVLDQKSLSPQPTAGAALRPVFDIAQAMEVFGLPEETFQEVAELIVQQIPDLLASMERDVAEQLQEEARAKAHVLRGSMANAIFPSLKEPSQWLHREIRNGEWQSARQALDRLTEEFAPILDALRNFIEQDKSNPVS
ncbi:MAG: ATP-binding protein [Magnetococcus sp. DMHC-1]